MKLSTPDKPRRRQNFFVGRLGLAERDIVAQLSEEQVGILHRKSDAGAQIGGIILSRVDAIDQNAAFLGFVEAEQQTTDGGLARSDPTDDADLFAAFDLERDLFQRVAGGVRIGKADVLESNPSFIDFPGNVGALRRSLALQRHDAVDRFKRRQGLGPAGDHRGNPGNRGQHAARQHVGGHQRADRELAVEDEKDTDDHQQGGW